MGSHLRKRVKHTVRCTQTLMTPVEHLAQTLIGSTVVTRTCSLCTAKDPCTSRPMAPADHRDANKHGRDGGRMRLQPPRTTRPVQQPRTQPCNTEAGGRLAPDLNASKPPVMLFEGSSTSSSRHGQEHVHPSSARRSSLLQCVIIKKTAKRMRTITVASESASHTGVHSRGIMCACGPAPGAVAARHLMHLSMDGCSSCREALCAALLGSF